MENFSLAKKLIWGRNASSFAVKKHKRGYGRSTMGRKMRTTFVIPPEKKKQLIVVCEVLICKLTNWIQEKLCTTRNCNAQFRHIHCIAVEAVFNQVSKVVRVCLVLHCWNLAPLSRPIIIEHGTDCDSLVRVFPRFTGTCRLHVFAASCDWFTVLSVFIVIG